MHTRTEQGAIACSILLVSIPYVAVPAYWVLGGSRFEGYVTVRRLSEDAGEDLLEQARDRIDPYRVPHLDLAPAWSAAERLADQPMLSGNSVELLVDGRNTFDSLLAGIDRAESYILFQFFIVKDDRIGTQVKDRLIARARTGVRFFRYRDGFLHQKVMLVDDDVATVGTANFDNRSFRLNFETTAVIIGIQNFIEAVETMFEIDFAHSREVPSTELNEKSWCFAWR